MATSLKFYDVKARRGFSTGTYTTKVIKGRRFAIASTPSGSKAYRILGK